MHEAFLVCIDDLSSADVVDSTWLANCSTVVEVWVMAVIDEATVAGVRVRCINRLVDIV